jgi:TRAP-type C4-dicarboxylate transport system substrate-binding protein
MAPCAPRTEPAHIRSAVAAVTEKTLFEKLLTEQQEEIGRLSKELAAEKEENAELKAKLAASQALPSKKRKGLGGRLYDLDD